MTHFEILGGGEGGQIVVLPAIASKFLDKNTRNLQTSVHCEIFSFSRMDCLMKIRGVFSGTDFDVSEIVIRL